jgi:beta-lactamase regulating signal transducer with metallopeptidase domain
MTQWVVQALVASGLLMLLVIALRNMVASAFGPRAAYALWALPALRLLLPSLPGWHQFYVPVWHVARHEATVGLVDPASAARIAASDLPQTLPVVASPVHIDTIPWSTMLATIWLVGAALWFGWQMLRYLGFLAAATRSARRLTRECGVEILLSDHVDGPVAAGVFRRRIFLPADFMTRYSPGERRLALLHEGAHHDRGDILANLIALLVLALHWWNPLAYRAYRLFRADQELACDATVLAGAAADERHVYGSAVLKSVSARMPGVACALSHKAELKRRLRTMARPALSLPRRWAGAAVALSAIGAGLLVTASGHATAPDGPITAEERAEIRAAADEARREAMIAAAEARRDAEAARTEALHYNAEARREVERARHAADSSRAETLRDAARARMEGERAAWQGWRAADNSRAEALREAARARAEAERARLEGEQAARQGWRVADAAQSEIAATRRALVASCAAKGRPVSPDLDWSRLALCGDTGETIAQRALAEANRDIARSFPRE